MPLGRKFLLKVSVEPFAAASEVILPVIRCHRHPALEPTHGDRLQVTLNDDNYGHCTAGLRYTNCAVSVCALTPATVAQVPGAPNRAAEAWLARRTAAYKAHVEASEAGADRPGPADASQLTTTAGDGGIGLQGPHTAVLSVLVEGKSHQQAGASSE